MSEAAARERLTAWQRWELASLGCAATPAAGAEAAARAAVEDEVAQRCASAEAQAHARGHAAGLAAAAEDVERLRALVARLATTVEAHEQRLADEVLDVALVFARQMVGQALSVRRELVLPVVATALSQLPHASRHIDLRLNPDDLALVKGVLPADHAGPHVALVGDPSIAPGGCLVETEQAAVDATLPTRWRRLLAGLGREHDWLEPA